MSIKFKRQVKEKHYKYRKVEVFSILASRIVHDLT